MKFAVAGKGGVGKTFVSGTLARLFARDGYKVLAIDADPNINTASSLGIMQEVADGIVPLSDNEDLIREKTGNVKRVVVVEMNLGQYVKEIERILPNKKVDFLGQMDGRLITPHRIKEVIDHV